MFTITKTISKKGTVYKCGSKSWSGQGSASAAYAYYAKLSMIVNDVRKTMERK